MFTVCLLHTPIWGPNSILLNNSCKTNMMLNKNGSMNTWDPMPCPSSFSRLVPGKCTSLPMLFQLHAWSGMNEHSDSWFQSIGSYGLQRGTPELMVALWWTVWLHPQPPMMPVSGLHPASQVEEGAHIFPRKVQYPTLTTMHPEGILNVPPFFPIKNNFIFCMRCC